MRGPPDIAAAGNTLGRREFSQFGPALWHGWPFSTPGRSAAVSEMPPWYTAHGGCDSCEAGCGGECAGQDSACAPCAQTGTAVAREGESDWTALAVDPPSVGRQPPGAASRARGPASNPEGDAGGWSSGMAQRYECLATEPQCTAADPVAFGNSGGLEKVWLQSVPKS